MHGELQKSGGWGTAAGDSLKSPGEEDFWGGSKGLGGGSCWPNRLESEGVQADQEAFHGTRGGGERVLGLVCPRGKLEILKKNTPRKMVAARRRRRSRQPAEVRRCPEKAGGGGGGAGREVGGGGGQVGRRRGGG